MSSPPQSTNNELLVLTLVPDVPVNTTITDASGKILYTAETLYPKGPKSSYAITHFCGSQGETLAALEWHDVLSDVIAFGTDVECDVEGDAVGIQKGCGIRINEWMKSSIIPLNSSVSLEDDQKRKYKWKGCCAGGSLELHVSSIPTAIAQFQKPRPHADPPQPARLLLAPRAQEIADIVVLSFLCLEKRRRANENSTQNLTDALGVPPMDVRGGRLRNWRGGGV